MSDEKWFATVVGAVFITLFVSFAIGISRSARLSEESYHVCLKAGNKPVDCRSVQR